MNRDAALYQVKPVVYERKCGGWLAVTPKGWPLCVGVTAESEEKARINFENALTQHAHEQPDKD